MSSFSDDDRDLQAQFRMSDELKDISRRLADLGAEMAGGEMAGGHVIEEGSGLSRPYLGALADQADRLARVVADADAIVTRREQEDAD